MVRLRYWKITADELEKITYPADKLLNWDIKCTRDPEEEARFVGVFMYRNGAALDYTPVKVIVYYHNNISCDEFPSITKFLKDKFGGEEMEKSERVFLKDSKEIFGALEIAALAKELEEFLKANAIITLEFQDLTEDAAKEAGLPEAKLLPIPGK